MKSRRLFKGYGTTVENNKDTVLEHRAPEAESPFSSPLT